MARSKHNKPDLISRQELLRLMRDHADKIRTDSPLQHAILAYWQTVVEALPAKAVLVDLVHCGDCKFRHSSEFCECRPADAFCSDGERRADHGKE